MVFYRKYRPQKIEELDSSALRDTLHAVLSKISFPHAFLFTGPKGLGKTSTARIVAKIINCEKNGFSKDKRQDIEPCNKCGECLSIANGSNFDVIEIDGASNRGIDEIRDLKEKINLSTTGAFKKVYIIDEVHMLTGEAFNALLKTLEEPPSHAVFILCTTEPQKLPATIISRCFHVQFKKATSEELIRSFLRIVSKEKLSVDKEALIEIASLSDGSFRDGVKILEEIVARAGRKKITKELVEKEYKTVGVKSRIASLISLLKTGNTKESLVLIGKLEEEGTDMKYFMEELISALHSMLLLQVNGGESELSLEEIKRLIELLLKASSQTKYAILPQLPLELAIVEFTATVLPHAEKAARQFDESSVQGPVPLPPVGARSSLSASGTERTALPSGALPRATLHSNFFEELILKVNTENRTAAGLLRGCVLKSVFGKNVLIETKFKFHKEKLEDPKVMDILEKIASEILKKNVKIDIKLEEVKRNE